jgi:hypothetical protein
MGIPDITCPLCKNLIDTDCCIKEVGYVAISFKIGIIAEIIVKCNSCFKKFKIIFEGGHIA